MNTGYTELARSYCILANLHRRVASGHPTHSYLYARHLRDADRLNDMGSAWAELAACDHVTARTAEVDHA